MYIKNNIIKNRNEIVLFINGYQIFNPSEEMLFENGWKKYEQPKYTESRPVEVIYKDFIIDNIRLRYSIDDEIAILRQKDEKIDEFKEYNNYVEECKLLAKNYIENYVKENNII